MSGCVRRLVGLASCLCVATALGCGASPPRTAAGVDSAVGGIAISGSGRPTPQPVVPVPGCEEASCQCLGTPSDWDHAELFRLLNEYRMEKGLDPLKYSLRLEVAADGHAKRMADEEFFDHVAPDGTAPADRAQAVGFCHDLVGENIAYGLNSRDTPARVMAEFQGSPVHDQNMLYEDYRYVGIGVYHRVGERGDEYWWVQMMALE